jgi:glutathione S-transferase
MIVYGASMSPYVRKVLAFAAEKGLDVENRPVGFDSPDPGFLAASPFRKIPAFEDGDFRISDSSAIIAYLDALKPDPNLIPTAPAARARTIWFEEFADTMIMDCGRKMFFNRVVAPLFMGREGDLQAADLAEREQLPPLLDYLESVVTDSLYLVEDRFTLADIAVASPFANVLHHLNIAVDQDRYPRTLRYLRHILERPSLKAWIDKEVRFLEKVRGPMAAPAAAPATA